jgi:PKD repeat protein
MKLSSHHLLTGMNYSMVRSLFGFLALLTFSANLSAQRAVCPQDTLKYLYFAKATDFDTTSFDPTFTSALYQYYAAPQAIRIEGIRFFGFKTDSLDTNGLLDTTMTIYLEVRNATQDSLPGANLLAADTIVIHYADTTDTTYPLNYYSYVGMFDDIITTSNPYTVIVRTDATEDEFSLLHTEYDEVNGGGDGDQQWLSGAFQGSGWVKSNVFAPNVNNVPFDADFFIEPIVSYNLNASFINDPECLFDELGDTVSFFNDGATIVDHPMYNRFAAFNLPLRQTWNFGDGSPVINAVDPLHFYPTNGPFAATFTATILSWSQNFCSDNVTQIIKEKPTQDFSYTTNNLDVDFTNLTFGLFTSISWDFGDGNTSSTENPKHKYAAPGTYWVCQTMMTSCGEITQCKNVAVATNTSLSCGKDSVRYHAARGTDTRTITLRNPPSGQRLLGVGMRFDAPQAMVVHGFSFYANHNGLFRDAYPVTCRIWLRDEGGLPNTIFGPLGETTVRINKYEVDTFYNDTLRYTAIFDVPANLSGREDYILTIEYDEANPVLIGTTDWAEGDGDQDFLAYGKVNDTTWVTAQSVAVFNVNGQAFNADVIMEPIIEHGFDANFSYPFECLIFGSDDREEVQFTDLSSRIARSEIYNQIAFYGSNTEAFEWDFGDSSGISNQINARHLFEVPGPFDVSLTITIQGWTNTCQNTQVLNMPVPPTGGFSYEQVTSAVQFIDESHNADEYRWVFSDTAISTLANPIRYFERVGKYEACQYVSNVCGSDTVCDSITINIVGIPEDVTEQFQVFPNPSRDFINVSANLNVLGTLTLNIRDMSGRLVRNVQINDATAETQINVSNLATGAYMMEIIAAEYRGTRKLIISR